MGLEDRTDDDFRFMLKKDLLSVLGTAAALGVLFLGQTMYRDNKREEGTVNRAREIVYNAPKVRVAGRVNLFNCYTSENVGFNRDVLRYYRERAGNLNPGKSEQDYEWMLDLDGDGVSCRY